MTWVMSSPTDVRVRTRDLSALRLRAACQSGCAEQEAEDRDDQRGDPSPLLAPPLLTTVFVVGAAVVVPGGVAALLAVVGLDRLGERRCAAVIG
jgi:hypothetical protein